MPLRLRANMIRPPDWLIYGIIVLILVSGARGQSDRTQSPSAPPKLGPALPNVGPSDPNLIVELPEVTSSIGTAFAIDDQGTWITARHVVDSCDKVGLRISGRKFSSVYSVTTSKTSDTAILKSRWFRPPLAQDLDTVRSLGEYAYFIGFPQGKPGEAVGSLIGRNRMVVRGRYNTREAILAWVERGRSKGLSGSLGGLSGGPAFDKDGEVIGVVAAESPRRGRIYTVAPASLRAIFPKQSASVQADAEAMTIKNYGRRADRYRRDRRIAQVMCLVR